MPAVSRLGRADAHRAPAVGLEQAAAGGQVMTKVEIIGTVVSRTIVGEPRQVANSLVALRRRGDLASWTPPRYLSDGRVAVSVRVVDRTPAPRPVRRVRTRWVVTGVATGTALAAGVGYLVYLALPVILVVAAIVAVVWFLLGQRAACPGLHCPGCRCHR
jgi:hypothetical protein